MQERRGCINDLFRDNRASIVVLCGAAPILRPPSVSAVRRMVPARGRPYPRGMTTTPQEQASSAETELTETEQAEIEARLRELGYID